MKISVVVQKEKYYYVARLSNGLVGVGRSSLSALRNALLAVEKRHKYLGDVVTYIEGELSYEIYNERKALEWIKYNP
jgi:hypothetical protein